MNQRNFIKDGLMGLATGDALGVPAEFKSREWMKKHPVTEMKGFGTYNLPPGNWSDDTSLACCLAEALIDGIDINAIAANFVRWRYEGWWTPFGTVFDIGIGTSIAIDRIKKGTPPELAGGFEEDDNGNGSLMRILPLACVMGNLEEADRYALTKKVSSLTHGHIRSVIACHYYLEFIRLLMGGMDKLAVFDTLGKSIPAFLNKMGINPAEIDIFRRLFDASFPHLPATSIYSTGYVLHTLEASVWCLLQTDNYADAVLLAVNLGEDTDTTGAVTGGLAGICYGEAAIPEAWKSQLVKRVELEDLATRMHAAVKSPTLQ